jgi:hypothetical protein
MNYESNRNTAVSALKTHIIIVVVAVASYQMKIVSMTCYNGDTHKSLPEYIKFRDARDKDKRRDSIVNCDSFVFRSEAFDCARLAIFKLQSICCDGVHQK